MSLNLAVYPQRRRFIRRTSRRAGRTAQGQRIQILATGGSLKINNATVVKADVPAANGVTHVIDTVLLPK